MVNAANNHRDGLEIARGEGTHSVAEGIRWPILAEESVGCCVVSGYDYVGTAQVGDFYLRGVLKQACSALALSGC